MYPRKGLVIGCGWECHDPISRIDDLPCINHNEIHPKSQFETLNLPHSYLRADYEYSLSQPNLSELVGKKYSQIVLERIPVVALDKASITNLSNLLEDEGLCILALSGYIGGSVGEIGYNFHSGNVSLLTEILKEDNYPVEEKTYNISHQDNYEFFHNLNLAGFKTVLSCGNSYR